AATGRLHPLPRPHPGAPGDCATGGCDGRDEATQYARRTRISPELYAPLTPARKPDAGTTERPTAPEAPTSRTPQPGQEANEMTDLRATMRLQFHAGFTLDDAVEWVDYFDRLGISHIYASPLLTARPGSLHGYDVSDPTRVNPELGGEEALRRLVHALRERGMGLILDLVPNHTAADCHNPWWQDVLLWGSTSLYASFFDINWQCQDPYNRGRVLLPILADDYLTTLKQGNLRLTFVPVTGCFYLCHHDHQLPVALPRYARILADSGDDSLTRIADRCAALEDQMDIAGISHTIHGELIDLARGPAAAALERAVARYNNRTPESAVALHQ